MRKKQPETKLEKFKEFYSHNKKRLLALIKLILISFFIFIGVRITKTLVERFYYVQKLNSMVNQMAQILDNVRTLYAIGGYDVDINRMLIKSQTIPANFIKNGKLVNMYGGNIIITKSAPVIDEEGNLYPTFKISYQGLSRDICVAMATITWEGIGSGLIAEATGYVDENGIDTALHDIEQDARDINLQTQRQYFSKEHISTVAKPFDRFIPTPFNKYQAMRGCACIKKHNCSFAMRYYAMRGRMKEQ